jgi:N-acetylmuramoyl-L-alanine amidase
MKTFCICIGVGHGGSDPGAVNGKRRESDDNLRVALALARLIEKQGHKAVLTRDSDKTVSIDERRQIAIDARADLFIDLHRNSHADVSAQGTEIWIRDAAHAQAAHAVLGQLAVSSRQKMRGVKTGAYRVLYAMPMPAMLLELGFISNAADNALFDTCFDDNVLAIAKGILSVLGQTYKEPDEPVTGNGLYRVQLGAFKNEKNALALRDELAGKGYACFVVAPD